MNLFEWLKANTDKFDVMDNASNPFVDYTPTQPLFYKGAELDMISVHLNEDGEPNWAVDSFGKRLPNYTNMEKFLTWTPC